MSNSYPETARNKLNRYRMRAAYDYETIHSIVNKCPLLNVSYSTGPDDPFPTIYPMIGAMGSWDASSRSFSTCASDPQDLYVHGSISTRLMRMCSSPTQDEEEFLGVPMCVSASILDGFVLAYTPQHSSMNYRSVIIYGYGTAITDPDERFYALHRINNNAIPERWENCRTPPTKAELQATSVIKIRIESASAKTRTGNTGEARNDLKNDEMRARVWSGVVPCWTEMGEPVASEHNRIDLPSYLRNWVDDVSHENRTYSEGAAVPVEK